MKLKTAIGACALWCTAVSADGALDNTLSIIDTSENSAFGTRQSPEAGHVANVTLSGSEHGAQGLITAPLMSGLTPGLLVQEGLAHRADITISGASNGFAALQSGSGHRLSGFTAGSANTAQVVQSGSGQVAAFRQVGARNNLRVRQSSW